jgi:hypothetical protein
LSTQECRACESPQWWFPFTNKKRELIEAKPQPKMNFLGHMSDDCRFLAHIVDSMDTRNVLVRNIEPTVEHCNACYTENGPGREPSCSANHTITGDFFFPAFLGCLHALLILRATSVRFDALHCTNNPSQPRKSLCFRCVMCSQHNLFFNDS